MVTAMVTAAAGYNESPFDVARINFEASAGRVLTEPDLRLLLSSCSRDLRFELPIRLDSGELRLFHAFRTHHSSGRGPHLGALRFAPDLSSGLMFALAQTLTWKAGLAEVHFAGSMGGVLCNPAELSVAEMERITRAYVACLQPLLGPFKDILQLEPGANPRIADWIQGEYTAQLNLIPGAHCAESDPVALACVVGKAEGSGGLADGGQLELRGVVALLRRIAEERGKTPAELSVALYGANGASRALAEVRQLGCKWIGAPELRQTEAAAPEAALQAAADVLILAGGECAVNTGNVTKIVAPVIIEAADLSLTPVADMVLAQKGTIVIPSLVANAGAVIAAHLEWDANLRQAGVGSKAAGNEIELRVLKAYDAVRRRATECSQTLRAAAYDLALDRVAAVERLRKP